MGDLSGFNANNVEILNSDFSPIPAGKYVAVMDSYEKKESKSSPGNFYFNCQFGIVEGEFKNRKIFHMLNLFRAGNSENDIKAKKIAQSDLAKMCIATGVPQPDDLSELQNKPMIITVKIQESRTDERTGKTYDASNKITDFKPYDAIGGQDVANKPAPTPQPPAAQANPWDLANTI